MKKKKRKNIIKSLTFMFERIKKNAKIIIVLSFFSVPINVANQLINVYMSAYIVNAVIGQNEKNMIYTIFAFTFMKLLLMLSQQILENKIASKNYFLKMCFVSEFTQKYMNANFAIIESTEGKDLAQRAKNAMSAQDFRDKPPVEAFINQLTSLVGNVLGFFVYASIIAILDIWILGALIVVAGINYFLQYKMVDYEQKDKKRYIPLERKIYYIIKESKDLKSSKDIKIYKMINWLSNIFDKTINKRIKLFVNRGKFQFKIGIVTALIEVLFSGLIYYYLASEFFSNSITATEFVLYFGLIVGFNQWINSIIIDVEGLHKTILGIDDLREFHDLEDMRVVKEGQDLVKNDIVLMNISYRYPESETYQIEKLNLNISSGEKIAIVGVNGSGKTTLVKLICGLYTPQEGQVLIGGENISGVSQCKVFKKMSVVFQDIYILPTTIERNITLSDMANEKTLNSVLEMSGLNSKINELPNKEKTNIVTSILEDSIDLSGGEIQKLALARALYKGGDIIILDEPTAALDPIAEHEMYQRYNELTKNSTSIFISHRLSSTRFCDRILFMEHGAIVECGSHDELMKLQGKYFQMYNLQSHYYQSDIEVEV